MRIRFSQVEPSQLCAIGSIGIVHVIIYFLSNRIIIVICWHFTVSHWKGGLSSSPSSSPESCVALFPRAFTDAIRTKHIHLLSCALLSKLGWSVRGQLSRTTTRVHLFCAIIVRMSAPFASRVRLGLSIELWKCVRQKFGHTDVRKAENILFFWKRRN